MKKRLSFIFILYIFLFICGSVHAVGEKTISLGGSALWNNIERRSGVCEALDVRPFSVLMLSSSAVTPNAVYEGGVYSAAAGVLSSYSALTESALDMFVSFDEREPGLFKDSTGIYKVRADANLERVDRSFSRNGAGAVLFGSLNNPISIEPQSRNALFAPGRRIGDFTIEFWLYPINMENGEKIFSWVSTVSQNGINSTQSIRCVTSKNRLQWSFNNFFVKTRLTPNISFLNLEFSGNAPVVPKSWSHHLIRFDANTGMLEYIVDGNSEAIVYATGTGRESGEVFLPLTGNSGAFLLGESYSGIIDELKIHNVCAGRSSIQKYPLKGGRMETAAVDLGVISSSLVRIDAKGGRTGKVKNSVLNEFRENGRFRFSDETQIHFFFRVSDNPWLLKDKAWIHFIPGEEISNVQGRYVQIAADFYPSSDGEASPYLEQLNIIYIRGEPPLPPQNVTAIASDGGVQLRWRHSPDIMTDGYLIYYSSVRGELFGKEASLGASPVDVGMTNSVFIDGLKNGVLYYFRIAAYDRVIETTNREEGKKLQSADNYIIGEFSSEVTSRPLAGL